MVESYNYDFRSHDRIEYFVNEQLNYKIPNFFSFEPSYSIVVPHEKNKGCYYKFQLGLLFTQTTLKYTYQYNSIAPYTSYESYNQPVKTSYHPQSFPINFSFSYVFK